MAIYLVQHGKSLPKEQDPEQSLSKEGIEEVKRIASVAKGYRVRVAAIKHSGKKRAAQTAGLFASELQPAAEVQEMEGLKPLDDVTALANQINKHHDTMFVGHLPFMEKLTSFLITGSVEKPVFKFQNGGIVCLDKDPGRNGWIIKWTLMPHIG